MDKFIVCFRSAEEALPQSWKLEPLPKSSPKRPVGRPSKRKLDDENSQDSQERVSKKVCVDSDIRKEEMSMNSDCESVVPRIRGQYNSFTSSQRSEVVEFSKLHGVRATARH